MCETTRTSDANIIIIIIIITIIIIIIIIIINIINIIQEKMIILSCIIIIEQFKSSGCQIQLD